MSALWIADVEVYVSLYAKSEEVILMKVALLLIALFSPQSAEVTAYCAGPCCCGEYADGITASGYMIQDGDRFVATPTIMSFGTLLYIPDYGLVPVLDRGGAITGNKLDVYFPTHQEALVWGRKHITVYILED